jgi:hypothetical protein
MCQEHHELVQVLRAETIRLEQERERYRSAVECMCSVILQLRRQWRSIDHLLEDATTRITGVDKFGNGCLPPPPTAQ